MAKQKTAGDITREAAQSAADSIPDEISENALDLALKAAAVAYDMAPPRPHIAPPEVERKPEHIPPTYNLRAAVKPPLVEPDRAALLALFRNPFAYNSERLVVALAKAGSPIFEKTSIADMTLAEATYVARLVEVYNETEQTAAARFAGVE